MQTASDQSRQIYRSSHALTWLQSWAGLVHWSLIRHKYLLPAFTIIQALFAVAIVFGLALLLPEVSLTEAHFLSAGAWTLGFLAIGCVLAPQIVSNSKQEGLLQYQRSLPVPYSALILADAAVWGLAALPGVIAGMIAATIRFSLDIAISPALLVSVVASLWTAIFIGYAIAYWCSQSVTGMVTQVIMIGGLLFSPITFPSERLPDWAATIHEFLPFAPMASLIRESAFQSAPIWQGELIVVLSWGLLAYVLSYLALRRRS